MLNTHLILAAVQLATIRHAGQTRKYTGEPYICHPIEVAQIVYANMVDEFTNEALETAVIAAILHDTVEDTATTIEEIHKRFGSKVARAVDDLTDKHPPGYGQPNRAERKRREAERLALACPEAQCVKLADLESNTRSIFTFDPNFAKTYLPEKLAIIDRLTAPPEAWRSRVRRQVQEKLDLLNRAEHDASRATLPAR